MSGRDTAPQVGTTPGPRSWAHRALTVVANKIVIAPSYLRRIGVLLVLALVAAGLSFGTSPASATVGARADFLVTFAPGTTTAERDAALVAADAIVASTVPVLRLASISVSEAGAAALAADGAVAGVEADRVREIQGVPNDPSYADQWALPQIGWNTAFSSVVPTGSATVAVLDTGVNPTPDLAGKLVPGTSMLEGVAVTDDPNGHGTAMASIVAAGADNGVGIAGVGYKGVSVMPVKVLDGTGLGQDSDIVEGVVYAADHGADVILMSFSNPGRSEALQSAADYAWSKGAVLVAATGNDASTTATFPAGLAKVVGVSATDRADALWTGSNSGADTFLAAPGVDISSGAGSITGTSASAAIAAGAAALVKANDPSASNGVVVGRLARTADGAGSVSDTGNGRVNLARALGDSSTDAVVAQGVAGSGGPIVGPYVAASNATITGTVKGTGSGAPAISGATVSCVTNCSDPSVTSNASGAYSLPVTYASSSTLTLRATAPGYSSQDLQIALASGNAGTKTLNFSLTPSTQNQSITFAQSVSPAAYGSTFTVNPTATSNLPVMVTSTGGCSVASASPGWSVTMTSSASACVLTASQAGNANFNSAPSVQQTVAAKKAVVAVNAVAGSKVYGAADPVFAWTYSGFVNGDTAGTSGISGSANCSRSAGESAAGSPYTITCEPGAGATALSSANYSFVSGSSADFTIAKKVLTVTADDKSRVYGSGNPAFTVSYSGFVGGDTSTSLGGTLGFDTVATAGSPVGSYDVTPKGLTSSNYAISFAKGILTVSKKALSVNAVADSKVYGAADPVFAWTYSGFVNGDTAGTSGISGSANCSRSAGESVGGSPYTITCGPGAGGTVLSSANYSFVSGLSAAFTITQATVTVTADPKTKVYGDADPALTFEVTGLANGDTRAAVVTGALDRANGQNVGLYNITQGTVSAGSNYDVNYVGAKLTITQATVTVTADPKTKVYGDADPALTFEVTGLANGDTRAAVVTGALDRANGQNVGLYNITQGTVSAGSNYDVNYVGAKLTITQATVTVTADPKTKVYGDADPALTFEVTGLANGDTRAAVVTGALDRANGQNVGLYNITQGTVSAGSNYDVNYVGAKLTITQATVTVTADPKTKVYGDADPALTFEVTGLANGDTRAAVVTGALDRANGQNVGLYNITQGTVSAGSNYDVNYVGAKLTITQATVTVTADPKTKVYGDADPALTFEVTGLANGDTRAAVVTGALDRANGQNVGLYNITQGTVSAGSNYDVNYVGAKLTITQATVTVTADPKTKVYGDADPALTFEVTGLANGDTRAAVVTGALDRANGQNVGLYNITQGTVSAGSNYDVNYVGAKLTITQATVTVTADPKTKVYGDADPALTFEVTGLANGDTRAAVVTGALDRANGQNVGLYNITQGTVSAGSNYDVNYVGAKLTITQATVTVTADPKTKVYGDADPALTFEVTGLANGDTRAAVVTGALDRANGQNVGLYNITQGTVSAGSNYDVNYVGAKLTITQATVTVTADPKTKVYGDADPALTFEVTGLANGDTRAAVVTGALDRANGQNVGLYNITQGTVSAGSNYDVNYVGAKLTITQATVTVTADPKTKVYGDADPALTFEVTGLANGDTRAAVVTGALDRANGQNVGLYNITQGTVSAGSNYDVNYVGAKLTITQATVTVTADPKTKVYGDADPALTFEVTGLANGDTRAAVVTGALDRANGQNVGLYNITQGTVSAGSNYDVNYVGAKLTITQATVTVTADPKTKVYGDADPALTFEVTGLANGDTRAAVVTGALDRANGQNVGLYNITQGTVSAGSNYDVNYVGAKLTITQATVTVTADPKTKVYGDADPALTFEVTGLANGDTRAAVVTGALDRANGQNVGLYNITQGTVSAGSNYDVNYVGAKLTITQATVTVTADPKTKVYGDADPALTFEVTGLANGDTRAAVVTGALDRANGQNVGLYNITQGTVSAGSNYDVNYVGAKLTITQATVTVTADPKTKVYGDADPALTFEVTGLANGDTRAAVVTGALDRANGQNVGLYNITQGTVSAGSNYDVNYVGAKLTITKKELTGSFTADNKVYNGTVAAVVTDRSLPGKVAGDAVSLSGGTASFDNRNVGTGKTVTLSGASLTGTAADNYTLSSVGTTTANITALPITGSFTAGNKVYDGNTTATVTSRSLPGKVANDAVSLSGGTASFDNENVGTGKTVTLTGAVLAGTDAGNYTLSSVGTATANIHYKWAGFFQPIDNVVDQSSPVTPTATAAGWNRAKAGSAIPVKFSLAGNQGLAIFEAGYPKVMRIACPSGTLNADTVEETSTTSGLKYDALADQYNYTWKTASTFAGTCQRLEVKLVDGTSHYAFFNLLK